MKIKIDNTFYIIILSFLLTGYYINIIVLVSIIIFHELGHFLVALFLKLNPKEIILYPYGGITKLYIPLNTNINKELLVAISGLIFQLIFFIFLTILYKNNLLREYTYNIIKTYHYNIFFFNTLPIYPLDGSKIINLILYKIFPYRISNLITIIISLIFLPIIIIKYQNNYTLFIIILILLKNILKYYHNIPYLYNKFLLERYLNYYQYHKYKIIKNKNNFYKENNHYIKYENKYYQEKEYLKRVFQEKNI